MISEQYRPTNTADDSLEFEYDNFVGQYDFILNNEQCAGIIDFFDFMDSKTTLEGRLSDNNMVRDVSMDLMQFMGDVGSGVPDLASPINAMVHHYAQKYPVLEHMIPSLRNIHFKAQKTRPSEGYHVWHYEDSGTLHTARVLVWMLYLNDIEEGGETEFLYLGKRIQPKAGRLIIWPAGFTHTHRGNPPLSGTKYVVTGWITLDGNPLEESIADLTSPTNLARASGHKV